MMRRRDIITLLGGAIASWPLAARAQQTAIPVIGVLSPATPEAITHLIAAFRQGMAEAGYVEGKSLAINYRFANERTRGQSCCLRLQGARGRRDAARGQHNNFS
jgi:putative ABC transport system substrate-binding protein